MSFLEDDGGATALALKNDREHFIEHLPSGFLQQSSKDQKSKLKRRQIIETNWSLSIDNCIPTEFAPRLVDGSVKGPKAKRGEVHPPAPWWKWHVGFIVALAHLSAITKNRYVYARELMRMEVQQRHHDATNRSKDTAEILEQDLVRLNDGLIKRLEEATAERQDEEGEDEDGDEHGQGFEHTSIDGDTMGDSVKKETSQSHVTLPDNTSTAIKREASEDPPICLSNIPKKQKTDSGKASRIATLRGKASRHRAEASRLDGEASQHRSEASRLEAEAYELEAKILRAED